MYTVAFIMTDVFIRAEEKTRVSIRDETEQNKNIFSALDKEYISFFNVKVNMLPFAL